MKICLDTCAYSRLIRHSMVLAQYVDEAEKIYIPSVVLGELFAGFTMGRQEKENRKILADFLELPSIEVASIDTSIADRYGTVVRTLRKQGTPIPSNDIWIAAVALETGSRLVTYDAHFDCIPGLIAVAP